MQDLYDRSGLVRNKLTVGTGKLGHHCSRVMYKQWSVPGYGIIIFVLQVSYFILQPLKTHTSLFLILYET